MTTAKYVNFNQGLPIGEDTSSFYSKIKTAGSSLNTSTIIIIFAILLFSILAGVYYYYYIAPKLNAKYHANSEQVPIDDSNGNNAEILFFYADWCPHCKTAKPIWNDLKTEYENKTINGYKITFTEINCSQETVEVEKLMNQYNVEGYPTIKLIKDGQVIEYDAKPTKETLTQFLNTVL
jgi:thiol-disulfide isomerase/thioredoxin